MAVNVVTRRDITQMSTSDQDRFFDAVDTMMINKNNVPGTSPFYILACIHGQPPPIYCEHGRETFPGWHRIYMMEFEKALQAADIRNGNNGKIGLPYWDWTKNISQGLPNVVYRRFKTWPSGFFPPELEKQHPVLRRASDRQVANQLRSWGVVRKAYDCLLNTDHWRHSSTQFNAPYPSIEHSHNDIHVIAGGNGGQMSSVAWAAFDIVFWLHHCMVDLIYESYLAIEPDSHYEFRQFQRRQKLNLYERPFEPFRKPNGSPYYPSDTFSTFNLGYNYGGNLLKSPPSQLREPPIVLVFENVKVSKFESKCYQIHCFIYDKNKISSVPLITTLNEIDYDSPHYAGGIGIFGRGMECNTCKMSPPRDFVIDITKCIKKIGISRYDAVSQIYILETTDVNNTNDNLLLLKDTKLPKPYITGPLFQDLSNDNDLKQNKNEISALQRYLKKFGYYGSERKIDGIYGNITKQAVKDFQIATGDNNKNGIANSATKNNIIKMKRCDNVDDFGHNDVIDVNSDYNATWYKGKLTFTYNIGIIPGYLNKDDVQKCIEKAFKQYTDASRGFLKFIEIDNDDNKDNDNDVDIDIKINWRVFKSQDDILLLDGPGGILGHGGAGFIEFDLAERWVIGLNDDDINKLSDIHNVKTWKRGQPTISLYYTALHEIGHVFGVSHSININDVMSPWYNPKQIKLSNNDINRFIDVIFPGMDWNKYIK